MNKELTEYFHNLYEQCYSECQNQEQAYRRAEELFLNKFNHRKYSGFNSFQVCRYKRVKRFLDGKNINS